VVSSVPLTALFTAVFTATGGLALHGTVPARPRCGP
jgi:hypothetical protein